CGRRPSGVRVGGADGTAGRFGHGVGHLAQLGEGLVMAADGLGVAGGQIAIRLAAFLAVAGAWSGKSDEPSSGAAEGGHGNLPVARTAGRARRSIGRPMAGLERAPGSRMGPMGLMSRMGPMWRPTGLTGPVQGP